MGWQESLMYFLSTLTIILASGAVVLLAGWRDVRSELGDTRCAWECTIFHMHSMW